MAITQKTRSATWRVPVGALLLGGMLIAGSAATASADEYEDQYFQILRNSSLPLENATQAELLNLGYQACYWTRAGVANWDNAARLAIDGTFDSEQMKILVSAAQDTICQRR